MSRTDLWPDADIAKLRELAAMGMPTAAIGAHMGRTKNSIVGKMLRLGIGYGHPPGWGETKVTVRKINGTGGVALGNMMAKIRGAHPQKRRSSAAFGRAATKRIERANNLAGINAVRRAAKINPGLIDPAQPVPATAVSIVGLTADTCRWPLWGDDTPPHQKLYCGGNSIEGLPYCGYHCARAFVGTKRSTLPTRHSPICETAQ